MQVIDITRRQRLAMLVKRFGTYAKLNEAIGLPATDAKLNRIANQVPRIDRPGKIFNMGDQTARDIEARLHLTPGWMDTPPTYAELAGEEDSQKAKLYAVMEDLPQDQYAMAIKLLAALKEHTEGTGTNG